MQESESALFLAFQLVMAGDADLLEIVGLSLRVSVTAVLLSCAIGLPVGALVASQRFRGRSLVILLMNALMGLPPVVIGLLVYLQLSASGPFGWLQWLYTPTAMILAQTLLVAPIVAALSRQVLEDLHDEYSEYFDSLCLSAWSRVSTLLVDARYSLLTVSLAGFGRAIAEVGAVMIVGGNINHYTRVMTTSIALETSKGDLPMALGLGIVLLMIALIVNALVMTLRSSAERFAYA